MCIIFKIYYALNSLSYVDNDKYHKVYAKYYITKIRFDISKSNTVCLPLRMLQAILCVVCMHASHIDKLIFGRAIGTNL